MALDNFREKFDVVIGLYLDMLQQPGELCMWSACCTPVTTTAFCVCVIVLHCVSYAWPSNMLVSSCNNIA